MPAAILPLTLSQVDYVANGRAVLSAISARLNSGSRTVILGPNGAGKSVLLRICHGLLPASRGSVAWSSTDPTHLRRAQAMVFQRPVLLRRSAIANIRYALAAAGIPRRERDDRAREALAAVELAALADSPAGVLSGGEQQRLSLARAWAIGPQVLFLDEPTSSLDPLAARQVHAIIQRLHEAGTKIVMTTHDIALARHFADEVLFLYQGRLLEQTPAAQFFSEPASPEAAAFVRGELMWS